MKITIGIEYHGAYFQGWQSQPNGKGVQDTLEAALHQVAQAPIKLYCAGRTDAGVHALMQIAHFDTDAVRPLQAWVRGVNAHLPPWVRVLWARPVEEGFHARFNALSRRYQYLLYQHPVAPAIQHGRVGWVHRPLSIAPMQTAIACLQGEHDFSAFRASECQASHPVRVMHVATVQAVGHYVLFHFEANAFLQHQIRNMVGALVYVGLGKLSVAEFQALLLMADRTLSPPTFMPDGLYFCGVQYAPHWQLGDTECSLAGPGLGA